MDKNAAFLPVVAIFALNVHMSANAADPEAIPSFYQEPGFSDNRDTVNQEINENIDPFTGKLQIHAVDLSIAGNGGLPIVVQRSYSSLNSVTIDPAVFERSAVGVGWTMHYGRVLYHANIAPCDFRLKGALAPVLELPDGSRQMLYPAVDLSSYLTQSLWKATCSSGAMTVYSPDGTRYDMTTHGDAVGTGPNPLNTLYTTTITDRNGNTLNIAYTDVNSTKAISSITASDGRQVNFTYGSTLESVSDGTRTWTYKYSSIEGGYPLLTEVDRPDGTSWKYDYNLSPPPSPGAYSIRQITYPTGGTVAYQYGAVQFNDNLPLTTVVTDKNGLGGSWKFAYNPATQQGYYKTVGDQTLCVFDKDQMFDRTIVFAPDGTHQYWHIGANSVLPGCVYAIGHLVGKSLDSGVENTYYNYTTQWISNADNTRPGNAFIYDSAIAATFPSSVTVERNAQDYTTAYSGYDSYGNAGTVKETGTNGGTDERDSTWTYDVNTSLWLLHLPHSQHVVVNGAAVGDITWDRDAAGNVLKETKYGVATSFTYTGHGDIQTKTDARGDQSTFSDYKRGIPQTENHPEGVTITRVVDDAGNITSQTDGEGAKTQYTYDGLNRLTKIIHPEGNPVTITWGPRSRVVKRGAYTETTQFDDYGRTQSVTDVGGAAGPIKQTYAYDPLSRKTFASYFNQSVGTFFKYDVLGRSLAVCHVSNPSGTSIKGGCRSTGYMDQAKFIQQNELGQQYVFHYRGFGNPDDLQLVQIEAPDATANVSYILNGLGQPLTIAQGSVTRGYGYDGRYFLTSTTNPETGEIDYGRDEVGNMISKTQGGSITQYAYDGLNRLKTITYPSPTPSVTRGYYKDDLIQFIDNGVARRDYAYTQNKKLKHESLTIDGKTFTVDYGLDGNDALSSMTYSTGLVMQYSPDGLGRPTEALPFAPAVSFFPEGTPQQIHLLNGLVTTYTLNARTWPNSVVVANGSAVHLVDLQYGYDALADVLGIQDNTSAGQLSRSLGYDSLNRLTQVDTPTYSGGKINYDSVGNLTSMQLGTSTQQYTYDASNRLSSVTQAATTPPQVFNYSYDKYGNVASNGHHQFVYDDASNLTCSDCGTANQAQNAYDGAGTRVKTTTPSLTTYFMYDQAGDLLFDTDSSGATREYGYVAGRNIAKKESP